LTGAAKFGIMQTSDQENNMTELKYSHEVHARIEDLETGFEEGKLTFHEIIELSILKQLKVSEKYGIPLI